MTKILRPQYDAERLAKLNAKYAHVANEVQACKLDGVRDLWESARINGTDTALDNHKQLVNEWEMPDLMPADVEAIITLASAEGLLTDRHVSDRTRRWFRNRNIIG